MTSFEGLSICETSCSYRHLEYLRAYLLRLGAHWAVKELDAQTPAVLQEFNDDLGQIFHDKTFGQVDDICRDYLQTRKRLTGR